jgi:drug/metabolite transporter (DMT)-like permease
VVYGEPPSLPGLRRASEQRGTGDDEVAATDDTRAEGDAAQRNLRGILAMVAACACFACGDTLMKLLSDTVPTSELIFIRGFFVLLGAFAACVWLGAFAVIHRALSWPMAARAVADTTGAWSFQLALARMPYADLTAIGQLSPLTITAASAVFLAEKVGWRRWTATAVGFLGVLLIIRPGSSTFNWWALAGIVSVLASVTRDLATRGIDRSVPPALIMLFSGVLTTSTGMISSFAGGWSWPPWWVVGGLFAAAMFSLLGQLATIVAVRSGELSAVVPFRYSIIIFALISGVVVFGHFPDALTLTGIVIVCAAGLYTFHREQVRRREAAAGAAAGKARTEDK